MSIRVAWEERIRRLVAASTNHAADFYEGYALDGEARMVTPDMNASDNWYGWAKIAFEQIGQVYASGVTHGGRPLENAQIRIGGPRETDVAEAPLGDLRRMRRALAVYISQRDMSQLFIKSIETEDIRDEFNVPFQIFYGISANSHGHLEHRQRPSGDRVCAAGQLRRALLRSDSGAHESCWCLDCPAPGHSPKHLEDKTGFQPHPPAPSPRLQLSKGRLFIWQDVATKPEH